MHSEAGVLLEKRVSMCACEYLAEGNEKKASWLTESSSCHANIGPPPFLSPSQSLSLRLLLGGYLLSGLGPAEDG